MLIALTDLAQKVVTQDAREIALRLGHSHIGTEHILLALLENPDNNALEAIKRFQVSPEIIANEILTLAKTSHANEEHVPPAETRFSRQGIKVVECAREEAHTMGHSYVGPEHIFLGLLREGEGIAYRILNKHGFALTRARKEVWMVLNASTAANTSSVGKPIQGPFADEAGIRISEHERPAIHPDVRDILINEQQIQKRVRDLGKLISRDYADKKPLLISVLKGSILFLSDLLREITVPCRFDLMTVSSYGDKTVSSGKVKLVMDLKQEVKGQDVIIVEDIFDTGRTLHYILEHIKEREPASMKVCVLLSKKRQHEVDLTPEYVGFEIPEEFVVGYGLDYIEWYRHLPYIAVLKPEIYTKK